MDLTVSAASIDTLAILRYALLYWISVCHLRANLFFVALEMGTYWLCSRIFWRTRIAHAPAIALLGAWLGGYVAIHSGLASSAQVDDGQRIWLTVHG